MWSKLNARIVFALCVLLWSGAIPSLAQQQGQWIPGQYGLNAGIVPDPGFTYMNLALNYNASTLDNANGNRINAITGNFNLWVDENIFMYASKFKFLGAHYAPYADVNLANGSLVAAGPRSTKPPPPASCGTSTTFSSNLSRRSTA